MDDLISRQSAIDALKEHRALFCDNTPDTFSKLSYGEKCRVDELDTAISTLVNLPSAQLDLQLTCNNLATDTISRQAAIDILYNFAGCIVDTPNGDYRKAYEASRHELETLPPAQPERKTGEWIGTEYNGYADGNPIYYEWECSECGCVIEEEGGPTYNYCPQCGADMRGKADADD